MACGGSSSLVQFYLHLTFASVKVDLITNNNPHIYSAIIDSGASCTVITSFDMIVPGSLHKLAKPIPLAGIAGGHHNIFRYR